MNRKKSVDKLPDGGMSPGAPYQIYKHANGKIELRSISNGNGNAPSHKARPSIGGGLPGNGS